MRGKLSIKLILFNGDMYNEHNVIQMVLGFFFGLDFRLFFFGLNKIASDFFSVYHFQHVAKMNSVIRLDTRAYVFESRS